MVTSTGPVERFLIFIITNGQRHTGEYLGDTILTFLEENGIDVENFRAQSYDNASNMSGIYNGMQSWILRKNPLAFTFHVEHIHLILLANVLLTFVMKQSAFLTLFNDYTYSCQINLPLGTSYASSQTL